MSDIGIWNTLDRLAFCENAILLHLTSKSRGMMTTVNRLAGEQAQPQTPRDRLCESFLDDVAMVVAGDGGKDNVAAACLETDPAQPGRLFVRIARNDGVSQDVCRNIQKVVDMAGLEEIPARSHPRRSAQDWALLCRIVQICTGRISKHIEAFQGEMRHARCTESKFCKLPLFSECFTVVEPRDDINDLGAYSKATHHKYAHLLHRYVITLRQSCADAKQTSANNTLNLCTVVESAYILRHATLLRSWLHRNLQLETKATVMTKLVEEIIKRIGKLARFYAAALTIARFVKHFDRTITQITVVGLPSHRIRVPELQSRTVANLRARGGNLLKRIPDSALRSKLLLWDKYRVHAEIQLLIYYEENQDLTPIVRYIGSDKLCCYLCYAFISMHATFKVHGCHQSLYSLWMVPDSDMQTLSPQARDRIHDVLELLCQSLQGQVQEARTQAGTKVLYHPGMESCDHLSRASLRMDPEQQRALLYQRLKLGSVSQSCIRQDSHRLNRLAALREPKADVHTCQQEEYQLHEPDQESSCSQKVSIPVSQNSPSPSEHLVVGDNGRPSVLDSYQQARFSNDLNIRGHESRACDVSMMHDTRDQQSQPRVSCIIDTSRKFDFHEMELFFENEPPNTVVIHAEPNEAPQKSDSQVIDILTLQYGEDYVFEVGRDNKMQIDLFFKKEQKNGMIEWLKLSWQRA